MTAHVVGTAIAQTTNAADDNREVLVWDMRSSPREPRVQKLVVFLPCSSLCDIEFS